MSTSENHPNDTGTDSPDHSEAASTLRIATFRLARRMRTQRAVDSMSDGQFAVLAALWTHGPHTLGDLADRERVSAPSMNRTVNCLQELGYVSRSADENDGWQHVISVKWRRGRRRASVPAGRHCQARLAAA